MGSTNWQIKLKAYMYAANVDMRVLNGTGNVPAATNGTQ